MRALNERGMLWLPIILISIPFVMLAVAVIPDLERAVWARNKLQSAADAAALAGALTATTVPKYETVVDTDAHGNITGVREVITGYEAEITDHAAADAAALDAMKRNTTDLSTMHGGFSPMEVFKTNDINYYNGYVANKNIYGVNALVEVKTMLLGPSMRLYGLANGDVLKERVRSYAKAVGEEGP